MAAIFLPLAEKSGQVSPLRKVAVRSRRAPANSTPQGRSRSTARCDGPARPAARALAVRFLRHERGEHRFRSGQGPGRREERDGGGDAAGDHARTAPVCVEALGIVVVGAALEDFKSSVQVLARQNL